MRRLEATCSDGIEQPSYMSGKETKKLQDGLCDSDTWVRVVTTLGSRKSTPLACLSAPKPPWGSKRSGECSVRDGPTKGRGVCWLFAGSLPKVLRNVLYSTLLKASVLVIVAIHHAARISFIAMHQSNISSSVSHFSLNVLQEQIFFHEKHNILRKATKTLTVNLTHHYILPLARSKP